MCSWQQQNNEKCLNNFSYILFCRAVMMGQALKKSALVKIDGSRVNTD